MPTIKDVAKLAGVSHGSVSNVINGSKTVHIDIVKKVNAAMEELGYITNIKARNLKSNKSDMIGIILPNISDDIYSSIYRGIEHILTKNGYNMCIFTTGDIKRLEENALIQVLQQQMLAVCIVSCNPRNNAMFKAVVDAGTRMVFIRRKPDELLGQVFAQVNEFEAIYKLTAQLLADGKTSICILTLDSSAFSNENDCIKGFTKAYEDASIELTSRSIQRITSGNEGAFQTVAWLMNSAYLYDVIITTCDELAKGAFAATRIFKMASPPEIYSLNNESWTQAVLQSGIISLAQKYNMLGQMSAEAIFNQENKEIVLDGTAVTTVSTANVKDIVITKAKGRVIKMLLVEGSAAYATSLLARKFTDETGIVLEIDTEPYGRLHEQICAESNENNYDIFQINNPWLESFINNNLLLDLTDYMDVKALDYSKDIIDMFCLHDGKLITIPYVLDVQIMFYRKDLFDNQQNQCLFFHTYQKDLNVPTTWAEYDLIARFFTKKFRADSTIEFGSVFGGDSVYGIYSFMLRFWELGGCIFDKYGNLSINKDILIKALHDYLLTFSYASQDNRKWTWAEQAQAFFDGKLAMMTIYQSHITDYMKQFNSKVHGEVGIASVPGNYNIKGGWSLGVSKKSVAIEEACELLKWSSSKDITAIYNILGGAIPSSYAINSTEMQLAKPWFYKAYKDLSKGRSMLESSKSIKQWDFENVFCNWLQECVAQGVNINYEKAAASICDILSRLIN